LEELSEEQGKMDRYNLHGAEMANLQGQYAQSEAARLLKFYRQHLPYPRKGKTYEM
jgi:hypothetical protein